MTNILKSIEYNAYGMPTGGPRVATSNRRKFGGKEYMTEFGLDELDFRAMRLDPRLGHFTTPDPLATSNHSISPWAYCNGDPINFIDPTGQIVVFRLSGEYLGHSSEGYTGQVYIYDYDGEDDVDFSKFTEADILKKYPFDMKTFDTLSVTGSEMLSGNAMSKIWTSIVDHFSGQYVYGEKFYLSSIPKGVIGYSKPNTDKTMDAAWITWRNRKGQVTGINGTSNLNYETTVENVASSVIVHEWYSHLMKGIDDDFKNHRFAFINLM